LCSIQEPYPERQWRCRGLGRTLDPALLDEVVGELRKEAGDLVRAHVAKPVNSATLWKPRREIGLVWIDGGDHQVRTFARLQFPSLTEADTAFHVHVLCEFVVIRVPS